MTTDQATIPAATGPAKYPFAAFAKFAADAPKRKKKQAPLDRLVADCESAENGQRSERDYALLAFAVENRLGKEMIWQRVQAIGKFAEQGRDYFERTWAKAESATSANPASRFPAVVLNRVDGASEEEKIPLTMAEILERLGQQTDGWPRRVDGALFIDDPAHGIGWLEKPADLFGWFHRRVGRVEWYRGAACVSQGELFSELRRTAQSYTSVETLPHEPLIDGHYYTCGEIQPGNGQRLRELLDRFEPATDIDRDLIQAAFMTAAWGGPAGCRPCFVITSDDGRGAGKTTVAKCLGHVWGGLLTFGHHEDAEKIKTRLLSPDALPKRICLLDNIKSLKFSWAELEGLITTPTIGGHRMYVGEGSRPNHLTWFITLNGASLSTDMAQRSVIIKVRRPTRSANWEEDTTRFIIEHREAIIADCIAALREHPTELDKLTRWATWERHILQRLPDPEEAQRVITERQAAVDVEADEAAVIMDHFAMRLESLRYDVDSQRILIPSTLAAAWYAEATGERKATVGVSRILKQFMDEGRLPRLSVNNCRSYGRGLIWTGQDADRHERILTDVETRGEVYH